MSSHPSASPSLKDELLDILDELNSLSSSPIFAALMERSSAMAAREEAAAAASRTAADVDNEARQAQQLNRLADCLEGLGDEVDAQATLAELQRVLDEITQSTTSMATKEERERVGGEARACGLLAQLL